MRAAGCGTVGKPSPLPASLHAVPPTASATSIIDEALGREGEAALEDISQFIFK